GALHSITTLTGSALLALALMHRFREADAIWRAAHVDEDWNFETWGFDDLAMTRRAAREKEFKAAALVLEPTAPQAEGRTPPLPSRSPNTRWGFAKPATENSPTSIQSSLA